MPPYINGSSSYYANVGSGATIDNLHAHAFTAEGWFRLPRTVAYQYLMYKGESVGWCLYLYDGEISSYVFVTMESPAILYTTVADDNTWRHFAITYDNDGDRKIRLWIDGVLKATSSDAIGTYRSDAANNGFLGGKSTTNGITGAHGWIRWSNSIRYTTTFTPAPRGTPPDVDANTVGQWNVTEGSGATIADSSGNANHGSLSGAYTWSMEEVIMANILTAAEAANVLRCLTTDALMLQLLPLVDEYIKSSTGRDWTADSTIDTTAKAAAQILVTLWHENPAMIGNEGSLPDGLSACLTQLKAKVRYYYTFEGLDGAGYVELADAREGDTVVTLIGRVGATGDQHSKFESIITEDGYIHQTSSEDLSEKWFTAYLKPPQEM
jgi:hypothetical protein